MHPNCNRPKFANQICNVSPMRSIGRIHAGYILNVPHFSDVITLCPKWGRSIKLGTLRSHDWVHSKSDQHFSQEQIKTTFMGTFSINPTFAHWAHWSHLLSVLPMYPACAWWVFGSLSPVSPNRRPSPPYPWGWPLSWVKEVVTFPEEKMLALWGTDATLYVRFLCGCCVSCPTP